MMYKRGYFFMFANIFSFIEQWQGHKIAVKSIQCKFLAIAVHIAKYNRHEAPVLLSTLYS